MAIRTKKPRVEFKVFWNLFRTLALAQMGNLIPDGTTAGELFRKGWQDLVDAALKSKSLPLTKVVEGKTVPSYAVTIEIARNKMATLAEEYQSSYRHVPGLVKFVKGQTAGGMLDSFGNVEIGGEGENLYYLTYDVEGKATKTALPENVEAAHVPELLGFPVGQRRTTDKGAIMRQSAEMESDAIEAALAKLIG